MNIELFKASLVDPLPPATLNVYQEAIWFAGAGQWDKAHELIQDLPDRTAAHIHAYLHRVEGDLWNADYWYAKAGKVRPPATLDEEWESIAVSLLK